MKRSKPHSDTNNITTLKIDGHIVEDEAIIEQRISSFFRSLFNGFHISNLVDTGSSFVPDYSNFEEFVEHIGQMSDEESRDMLRGIEIDELEGIVKECKFNKSPGLDGLSYEFYKVVWPVISNVFKDILQCQLDKKMIVDSNRRGATRLLPKVKGVPQSDELRPITLLNSDYKLLSKLLVKRIKPVMKKVICSSQLCTVEGRNILFGVNNLLSSVSFVNKQRRMACLFSLDFFKAYDRVLISYLLKVMKKMRFSDTFCEWIKMMHNGAKTCFILRNLTDDIQLSFSIRQGDPLAMILYVIYIEPLLLHLERKLRGIDLFGFSQILESFCYDVNVVTEHLDDLVKADKIISKFEAMSGAILSRNKKCKILGLGAWSHRQEWPLHYVQSENEIKVFGIFIKNNYQSMIKRNWDFRQVYAFPCIKSCRSKAICFIQSLLCRIHTTNHKNNCKEI